MTERDPHRFTLSGRLLAVLAMVATSLVLVTAAPAAAQTPTCDGQTATIVGTSGNDVLTGTDGPDVIVGLGGADVIRGRGGDDIICGNGGRDRIFGGPGDDHLIGGRGRDVLKANAGDDTVHGNAGPDRVVGGKGDDTLYGGKGAGDRIFGNLGNDVCIDGAATFAGCEYEGATPPEPARSPCSPTATTSSFDLQTANLMIGLSDRAYDIDGSSPAGNTLAPEPGRRDGTDAQQEQYYAPRALDDLSCWTLRHTLDIPVVDTQAYVAENIWTGDMVVAFRGSDAINDWLLDAAATKSDFRLPDGRLIDDSVHSGFLSGYRAVRTQLEGIVEDLRPHKSANPDARLFFTGHSLGGALATIASLDLSDDADRAGYAAAEVVTYTFGAPKAITKSLDGPHGDFVPNAHAVINSEDNVPRLLGGSGSNAFTHIEGAVVLTEGGGAVRIDQGLGRNFEGCLDGIFTSGHDREIYDGRLSLARTSRSSVSTWLVEDAGNFRMRWTGVEGPCDRVGVYYSTGTPNRNTSAQSSRDATADTNNSHRTLVNVGSDFWSGMENTFGDLIGLSRYTRTTPTVWLTETGLTDRLVMNWRMSDPGDTDWVYLFRGSHPRDVGIAGAHEVLGVDVRKLASTSGSDVLQTVGSGSRGTVWYIAYYERDGFGPDELLAVSRFVTP